MGFRRAFLRVLARFSQILENEDSVKIWCLLSFFAPLNASAVALSIEEVQKSVSDQYPLIQAAQQETRTASGLLRSSEGAFDLQWKTRASSSALGYYQNERVDSVLEQPTTLWGTSFFAGYRLGTGQFAIYDLKAETNPGGELRAGLNVPAWRDGPIDRGRAGLWKAKYGVQVADLRLKQQKIESLRGAAHRYWDWVAAGKRVAIFRSLLEIAQERDEALAERVRHGDLPDFERRDNERAILQRRSLLISSERSLQQATIELSLFMRDSGGVPIQVSTERLPETIPEPTRQEVPSVDLKAAFAARPELGRIHATKSQVDIDRRLAANQQAPRIDLQLTAAQSLRQGDPTRNAPRVEVGVLLEIPLQTNVAGGLEDAAIASYEGLAIQGRFQQDRITAEVQDAKSALDAALQIVEVTRKETALARRLEKGERERFAQGDSNLIFVNLREQATADAAFRSVEALANYRKSLANLIAALGRV